MMNSMTPVIGGPNSAFQRVERLCQDIEKFTLSSSGPQSSQVAQVAQVAQEAILRPIKEEVLIERKRGFAHITSDSDSSPKAENIGNKSAKFPKIAPKNAYERAIKRL